MCDVKLSVWDCCDGGRAAVRSVLGVWAVGQACSLLFFGGGYGYAD